MCGTAKVISAREKVSVFITLIAVNVSFLPEQTNTNFKCI